MRPRVCSSSFGAQEEVYALTLTEEDLLADLSNHGRMCGPIRGDPGCTYGCCLGEGAKRTRLKNLVGQRHLNADGPSWARDLGSPIRDSAGCGREHDNPTRTSDDDHGRLCLPESWWGLVKPQHSLSALLLHGVPLAYIRHGPTVTVHSSCTYTSVGSSSCTISLLSQLPSHQMTMRMKIPDAGEVRRILG